MLQIELCPEASSHLQELKDRLISISNDLLDNVNNLSPVQIDKLRQERFAIQYPIQFINRSLCKMLNLHAHMYINKDQKNITE